MFITILFFSIIVIIIITRLHPRIVVIGLLRRR